MRIFFLGKRYYTNQDALVQRFGRVFQLPLAWHRFGHPLRLVLLDYYGRLGDLCNSVFPVESVPVRAPRALAQLVTKAKQFKPDVVVASGDCFVGMLGHRLARTTGAASVFDVYDDYRTFGAYRAFLGWNALGYLCRRADLVTYASVAMAEEHDFANAYAIVPNGVDDTQFRPMPMAEVREKLGLPQSSRLVGYFGSMTPEHGVNELRKAVQKLRAQQTDVQLLLCGKEHPSTPVSGDGVLYRGMVPHGAIPDYLNACDVLALPYLNGAFLDKASSCKIAEYLYCGRPIVATRSPNFIRNFPEQAAKLDSLLTMPGDVDGLAESIRQQLDHPVIAEPPADMTWSQIADGLIPQLQQLLGQGRASP